MNQKLNFLSVKLNNQFIKDILPDGGKCNNLIFLY